MELLETIAQSYEIEKIITESNQYLIIVSPYLQINNRLKPKLDECFNRNIKTLILYRENMLTGFELGWFDQYKNVTLMSIKNLHAKCYCCPPPSLALGIFVKSKIIKLSYRNLYYESLSF